MEISAPCVVSLTWVMHDTQGQTIDELKDPLEFFYGGDDLLAKVEEALAGQQAGFETMLHLEPQVAFGDYDPDRVCFEDRTLFPEHLDVGMQFDGLPDGARTADVPLDSIYTVTEIYPSHVVLDGNHPLAGMALRLKVKVVDVRPATAVEIEQGSVDTGALTVLASAPGSSSLH
jgi:FKBP-type peptidyl-prolyl cis-trans isomerase SlyD